MAASSAPPTRLVLLGHGSRDPAWRRPFVELETALQARLGVDSVRLAFMEFAAPTLMDIAAEAVSQDRQALRVLPLFLGGGAHLRSDIPSQLAEIRKCFPQLRIELLPAIGEDARVQKLFEDIACEYAPALERPQPADDSPDVT